jgi:putative membrane protein
VLALLLPAIHLCGLALGIAALMQRARALSLAERNEDLKRVFFWDNLYALVAAFWLGSGLLRAFGGFEKGTDYYLANHSFWGKMLLLAGLLVAEGMLMVTFIRFRIAVKKGQAVALDGKARLLRLHWVEVWAVVGMIVFATLMARGVGVVRTRVGATTGPEAKDAQRLLAGKRTYQARCQTCHQLDGRGLGGKVAADFVGDRSRLEKSDAALTQSIAHGVPGTAMRGFAGELDGEEIQNVLAYVRSAFGAK